MFWKYSRFETKLLLHNRKSFFFTVFLLLFFLLFFMYESEIEPETLLEKKRGEREEMNIIFESVESLLDEHPEIKDIHENLLQQSSLINFQAYYLGQGDDSEQYIENGLKLNQLRLNAHDLGNTGIPEHFIRSKEEIAKEEALLLYLKEENLAIDKNAYIINHYFIDALSTMSGLLFLTILLISGSELLLHERRHQTITKGFPISFMKKVHSKVAVYFGFVFSLFVSGFLIGGAYLMTKLQSTNFSFPILLYQNGGYEAISIWTYIGYLFFGFALVSIFILYLSVLLNMLFGNAFANILVGLAIFFLPSLGDWAFFAPIQTIDFAKVLTGELAAQYNLPFLDWGNVLVGLTVSTLLLIIIIYLFHRLIAARKPKNTPISKSF